MSVWILASPSLTLESVMRMTLVAASAVWIELSVGDLAVSVRERRRRPATGWAWASCSAAVVACVTATLIGAVGCRGDAFGEVVMNAAVAAFVSTAVLVTAAVFADIDVPATDDAGQPPPM